MDHISFAAKQPSGDFETYHRVDLNTEESMVLGAAYQQHVRELSEQGSEPDETLRLLGVLANGTSISFSEVSRESSASKHFPEYSQLVKDYAGGLKEGRLETDAIDLPIEPFRQEKIARKLARGLKKVGAKKAA